MSRSCNYQAQLDNFEQETDRCSTCYVRLRPVRSSGVPDFCLTSGCDMPLARERRKTFAVGRLAAPSHYTRLMPQSLAVCSANCAAGRANRIIAVNFPAGECLVWETHPL